MFSARRSGRLHAVGVIFNHLPLISNNDYLLPSTGNLFA